jgi:hypothetical protein
MKKYWIIIILATLLISFDSIRPKHNCSEWGFFAHKKINRLAIFTLPSEMFGFYKAHADYLTEHSVDADKRRHSVQGEAPKHYIDLDHFGGDSLSAPEDLFALMPRNWYDAVDKFTEDSLQAYGTLPWNLNLLTIRLVDAFKEKDTKKILRLSADIGHYVGDAHVPLHTTENYNGQVTGQYGIHGFWESRLPELFYDDYDLFAPDIYFVESKRDFIWDIVEQSHYALDSVLTFEKNLSTEFPEDKKMSFEERGTMIMEVYSKEFSTEYHDRLDGMVERRFRSAIHSLGCLWYTCWVEAGQPDLHPLIPNNLLPPFIEQRDSINSESHPKRK